MAEKYVSDSVLAAVSVFLNNKALQNVIAVMIVGSQVNFSPQEHSDIDLYIILSESNCRIRGNEFIDNYEIEYFINPLLQVHHYLDSEPAYRPVTAHMLATGVIIKLNEEYSSDIKKLITKCQNILDNQQELTVSAIELYKYSIDDIRKDIEDLVDQWIPYQLSVNALVNLSNEIIFRLDRQFLPKIKHYPIELPKVDPEYYDLLKQVLNEPRSLSNISALVEYIEKKLGGKREDCWSLSSNLTINRDGQ
ncbi:MAG: hypothetical protein INQ03_14115 [Candidatus Heimdallarchaeota archaeon]|nr:hypothetical protein [Candidatus Heimdallarchaeota archaeon]